MKKFIYITLILAFSGLINAQKHNINFKHISVEQGLSNGTIYSIAQGKNGFMWFGTPDGLNKFDGYDFIVYKNDPLNPLSISNNNAGNIFIDKSGIIWIGTWGGGLNKFDPETGQFTNYVPVPDDPTSISDDRVQSIFQDSSGTLWFGTYQNGLNKLVFSKKEGSNHKKEKFLVYNHNPNNPNSLSNNRVWAILEDQHRQLWVATSNGLNCFDPKTEQFIHYYHNPDDPYSLSNNLVRSLYISPSGTFWIGAQNGLNRFDPTTKKFTRYFFNEEQKQMFGKSTINTIVEDLKGILWIGTQNGLYCFNPKTGAFTYFLHDARNPKSLSANEIRRVYVDRSGTIWIGTLGAGINRFNYEQNKFDHFFRNPHRMDSLSDNYIRAIFKDSSGTLWIGTRKGLNKLIKDKTKEPDYRLNRFQHFKYDPEDPDSLSHNEVWCIYEDRSKNLWIGTRNGGLNKFNRNTEKFTDYLYDPGNSNSLSRMGILSIYEDRSGTLWIGTYYYPGGLYSFDRSTGQFNRYEHNSDDPYSISHNEVWCIFEDHSGTLWIGTGNGLNKFNRKKKKFTYCKYITGKTNRMHINRVFCIYEDKAGILWIGTDWGLYRFNSLSGKFAAFFEQDGLPNNRILGILPDNDGNLWLSTNRGISRFNTKTKSFKNFDVDDGLQSKEFNPGAYFKSSDGKMYFGGVNGFNSFYPENIKDNLHIPPIVITDFKIFDKSVKPGEKSPLHKSITESDEIRLSYKDYVFSFDFVALNYIFPERNKYAYKLEGFDKDWIYTDASKRYAHYSNISPGKYIFRVIGSNNDSIWNREGTSIKITIIPPFWKTLWFKLIVLFLFCLIIYGFFHFKTAQIRNRAKILEHSVSERTKELQSSEEKYRTMIEHSNDMIWTLDEKGSFLYFNKKSEEITGYKLKDWYGKSFAPLILDEDLKMVENIFIKTMEGKPQHYELGFYDHKRNLLTLSVNTAPILKEGKVIGTVSFGRDITEKRKMEEDLFKASKLESIGTLAGGIAHDFNNILAGVIGNITLAKLNSSPEDKIFKILIKMEKASFQAKDLTNQLLTFAKGGAPVKKVTLIKDLIRTSVQFALTGSNIRCEFSIPDDLWPVEIDESQIGQVINNLIINAVQAMQEGGIIKVIAENIYINSEQVLPLNEGRYVKLSIEDMGTGISKEYLDKIFDPYFTTKRKGSGLGLSITYSIIKKHNGYVSVESDVGIGTTFYIYLPASVGEKLTTEKKKEKEIIIGKGRILLMDDEAIVRDVSGAMLKYIGYEVNFAKNGMETIELYRKAKKSGSPFDVVILDLTIPGGMGGEEAIKKLIKIDPGVKAIVSSGYSDDPIMSNFREYGFSGVLLKPYIIQELSEVLHKVMYEEKN